jgi:hypothetical protein
MSRSRITNAEADKEFRELRSGGIMRRIAVVGFAIWLAATIALRVLGQLVFRDPDVLRILVVLLISVPLMILVARAVLGGLAPAERALGSIALVAPGMLLDTFTTIWFTRVFPNIRPDAAAVFGGWLLLCNAVVLLTAALWRRRTASTHDATPVAAPLAS